MDIEDLIEKVGEKLEMAVIGNDPDDAIRWADLSLKLTDLERLTVQRRNEVELGEKDGT